MGEELQAVVLQGALRDDIARADAELRLMKLFGLNSDKAARLLAAAPLVVKRGLSSAEAEKYRAVLEKTGFSSRVLPDSTFVGDSSGLRLEGAPPKELKTHSDSGTEVCPRCGRTLRTDSSDTVDECPGCGIIISRYLSMKGENEAGLPDTMAASRGLPDMGLSADMVPIRFRKPGSIGTVLALEGTLDASLFLPAKGTTIPAAGWKLRFYAALASFSMMVYGAMIIQLPALVFVIPLTLLKFISPESSDDVGIRGTAVMLVVLYTFFILPLNWKGLTYGQRLMGVWIGMKKDPYAPASFSRLVLRSVGNFINLCCWGILNLLWGLVFSGRSFSDTISGTRQYDSGSLPSNPLGRALIPFALAMGGLMVVGLVSVLIAAFIANRMSGI